MSSLRAPWQNGPYTKKTAQHKHEEHQDATDNQKNVSLCFSTVFQSILKTD